MLAAGALIAITTVVLVIMYGQTRIFFAMCRDGLFPRRLAHVHPRYGTPARLTIGFGVLIAVLAAFVPLGEIVKLVNIGTLFAFVRPGSGWSTADSGRGCTPRTKRTTPGIEPAVSSSVPLIAANKGAAGRDVLTFARVWSQASGRPLQVVTVYPGPYFVGVGRTDAE